MTLLESQRDYMVLGWQAPNFTGGVDVSGYFLDYRTVIGGVKGQWHELNTKAVSERSYKVSPDALFLSVRHRASKHEG